MRTTRSGESALLLLDAVDVLVAQKIDYAVVGAIAASIHGAVRASMDADVVLSLAIQQAKELEQAFKATGFSAELSRVRNCFGGSPRNMGETLPNCSNACW